MHHIHLNAHPAPRVGVLRSRPLDRPGRPLAGSEAPAAVPSALSSQACLQGAGLSHDPFRPLARATGIRAGSAPSWPVPLSYGSFITDVSAALEAWRVVWRFDGRASPGRGFSQMEGPSRRGEYDREGPGPANGRALRAEASRLLDVHGRGR